MRYLSLMILLMLAAGCGRVTQIDAPNRRIMQGLQTAVSSKKLEWLEASVKLMEEQRTKGEMSDKEYAAFKSIVDKARLGKWDAAQKEAFALTEGQKPTDEDLEQIKPGAKRR
ncbi:MAG: hypothetical protein HY290_09635 [Planctomycetia bacterium]|nr:hypothetical protein [Planctomycetia bacterium]